MTQDPIKKQLEDKGLADEKFAGYLNEAKKEFKGLDDAEAPSDSDPGNQYGHEEGRDSESQMGRSELFRGAGKDHSANLKIWGDAVYPDE